MNELTDIGLDLVARDGDAIRAARAEADRILGEAASDALEIRNKARDAAQAVERAAQAQARQIIDAAEADALRVREQSLREARAAAVADAEAEAARIVAEARTQAHFEASHIRDEGARQARAVMLRVPPTTAPIHSSEISLREFPRSLRGLDAEAVSKWLALVEQSYALVEDELERRRRDLDAMLNALGDLRRRLGRTGESGHLDEDMNHARASWNRAVEIASGSVPSTRLGFDTLVVRTALMETPLRRQLLGFSREQVRRLLEASAAQLARLENQLHLTHAENERLRALFLEQLATPDLDG
jgi:cell division septum initiation protein DivIVA